ncbi:Diaminopimelate decarboxylase [Desulfovibrionales bacterium]
MHHFKYCDGELYVEDVRIKDLVETYGTPIYVYSATTLRCHYEAFDSAFATIPHLTCFAVKACPNLCVLRLFKQHGAGMDIVSGGELFRALAVGVPPQQIVYSGVGKQLHEIRQALEADILMFNVESLQELEAINACAVSMGRQARISLRINPDVDPKTHPYISTGLIKNKFGLDIKSSMAIYRFAVGLPGIEPIGIDCHIGSQITSLDPFLETLDRLICIYDQLKAEGIDIRYLDLGGGLGITYNDEEPPHPTAFGQALMPVLRECPMTVILEPGRVIAGNAGLLVTRVVYTKETLNKHFIIVDAAMNDLIRPSFYGSHHHIGEVTLAGRTPIIADVVGPICESGDFLARDRKLPRVEQGELLAIFSTGAYGFAMSSQYNSRPRAAELLVDGGNVILARHRETYRDLITLEQECLG